MTETLLTNGTIVTQNADREIIDDGAVAVTGGRITAVGTADRLAADTSPDRVIDAGGGAVIPGLINAHTHVSDILLRGPFNADRGLYDWLFNVKQPGLFAMDAGDHALAARLYCLEAIRSGTTTFVENDTALRWADLGATRRKLDVYDAMGVRSVYGAASGTDTPTPRSNGCSGRSGRGSRRRRTRGPTRSSSTPTTPSTASNP